MIMTFENISKEQFDARVADYLAAGYETKLNLMAAGNNDFVTLCRGEETLSLIYYTNLKMATEADITHRPKSVAAADLDARVEALLAQGYAVLDDHTVAENRFVTLRGGEGTRFLGYYPALATITEQADTADCFLPPEGCGETVCEPCLAVLGMEVEKNDNNGLGLILRLQDGRFLIVDGGYYRDADATLVLDTLKELAPDPERIVIAAWVITHTHGDHCGAFMRLTECYREQVVLERFLFRPAEHNFPEPQTHWQKVLPEMVSRYAGAETVYLHTGQRFSLGGAAVEILFTPENLPPAGEYIQPNTNSVVFTVTVNGHKLLVTGDASDVSMRFLNRTYGDYLKTDVITATHHGAAHGDPEPAHADEASIEAFYRFCDPKTVIWPTSNLHYTTWVLPKRRIASAYLQEEGREQILSGNQNTYLSLT